MGWNWIDGPSDQEIMRDIMGDDYDDRDFDKAELDDDYEPSEHDLCETCKKPGEYCDCDEQYERRRDEQYDDPS